MTRFAVPFFRPQIGEHEIEERSHAMLDQKLSSLIGNDYLKVGSPTNLRRVMY
jgi:hypothetical protein